MTTPRPAGPLALLLLSVLTGAPVMAGPREAESAGGQEEVVAVIHLHTTLGDGLATPVELARAARSAGVQVLVITDHLLETVSYAPWPVGGIIGLTYSRPSVVSGGIENYVARLAAAEREVPGVLLLPGVEISPFARWSGSLLDRTLRLDGWHRHVLVLGIENPRDLGHLPVAGNRRGGEYGPRSLGFLAPALLLAWAAGRLRRPRDRETRLHGFVLRHPRRSWLPLAIALPAAVVLVAGFPWRVERFSSVGGDPGTAPFRLLEDRVRGLGGVTSWAHPEASEETEILGIRVATSPYADFLPRTDADAFGALPEGIRTILPAGGLWDRSIESHLRGERASAPFALAELDEHRAAAEVDLRILQTVLLVRRRDHQGVVDAIRSGRMYARWTPRDRPPLRLRVWSLAADGMEAVGSGASLRARGPIALRFSVDGGDGTAVTARVVRRGEVIWSARRVPPFSEQLADDPPRPGDYRLDVEGAYPYRLISNPIFILPDAAVREGA